MEHPSSLMQNNCLQINENLLFSPIEEIYLSPFLIQMKKSLMIYSPVGLLA